MYQGMQQEGVGRQLTGDHRAWRAHWLPNGRFPGLHWFLNFSGLFTRRHNFIGTPQGLFYSITLQWECLKDLVDVDSRAFHFFSCRINCLSSCIPNIWSQKCKSWVIFVNLTLWKGRLAASVLDFELSAGPTGHSGKKEACGHVWELTRLIMLKIWFGIFGTVKL